MLKYVMHFEFMPVLRQIPTEREHPDGNERNKQLFYDQGRHIHRGQTQSCFSAFWDRHCFLFDLIGMGQCGKRSVEISVGGDRNKAGP